MVSSNKNIALCFDADYTLLEGYHPSIILDKRGVDVEKFWEKVTSLQQAEKSKGEKTNVDIIYLACFMHEVRYGKLNGLTIEEIRSYGKDLEKMCYPGIPDFFDKIKKTNPDYKISNNIISVGMKDLLMGSCLGQYMDNVLGYTFFDNLTEDKGIDEVKSTVSSSEKVSMIVAISDGSYETGFEFPIKDMIYFGDGQTDVPAFKFVKKRGGTSICVFNPKTKGAYAKADRFRPSVDYVLPADYRENSDLGCTVNEIINRTI